jgi:hypothetical protein
MEKEADLPKKNNRSRLRNPVCLGYAVAIIIVMQPII